MRLDSRSPNAVTDTFGALCHILLTWLWFQPWLWWMVPDCKEHITSGIHCPLLSLLFSAARFSLKPPGVSRQENSGSAGPLKPLRAPFNKGRWQPVGKCPILSSSGQISLSVVAHSESRLSNTSIWALPPMVHSPLYTSSCFLGSFPK